MGGTWVPCWANNSHLSTIMLVQRYDGQHNENFFNSKTLYTVATKKIKKERKTCDKLQIFKAPNGYFHMHHEPLLWSVISQINSMLKTTW